MRFTGFDVVALAAGVVAVVFSGFVLVYSTLGGLALLLGGGAAVSVPLVRERAGRTRAVATWLLVVLLFAVGVSGFVSGYGLLEKPELAWDSETSVHAAEEGTDVVVTGAVSNDGAVGADRVTVTARLVDETGTTVGGDTKRLGDLAAGGEQMFYFRFDDDQVEGTGVVDAEVEAVLGDEIGTVHGDEVEAAHDDEVEAAHDG